MTKYLIFFLVILQNALYSQIEALSIDVHTASVIPDSILTSTGSIYICPKANIQLILDGGSLGDEAEWYWYADGCNGTVPFDSGGLITYIMTDPVVTLFCTAEGGCNEVCKSITLFMETNPENCLSLPINLLKFSGEYKSSKEGMLSWQIVDEEANTHYVLEKSDEGLQFNPVYTTSSSRFNKFNQYSCTDSLTSGINYYRLKITHDNNSLYSNVIKLTYADNNFEIGFFPNPTNGHLKMKHNNLNKNLLIRVKVLDVFGKLILEALIREGTSFELPSPDGFYLVEATGPDGQVHIEKIIKISN